MDDGAALRPAEAVGRPYWYDGRSAADAKAVDAILVSKISKMAQIRTDLDCTYVAMDYVF